MALDPRSTIWDSKTCSAAYFLEGGGNTCHCTRSGTVHAGFDRSPDGPVQQIVWQDSTWLIVHCTAMLQLWTAPSNCGLLYCDSHSCDGQFLGLVLWLPIPCKSPAGPLQVS